MDIVKVNVPDGVSGDWRVESFVVTEEAALGQAMRAAFSSERGRGVIIAGTYKRLVRNGTTVMSNTPDEIRDQMYFVHKAKGDVLINGLGLGITLQLILAKPEVKNVTVIEKSKDVINLVAPTYLEDPRVVILNADAFEYKPIKGVHYDVVYHDVWDNITTENLPEMHKLHRKYGRKCDFQMSWCRERCEYYASRSSY
jgi:hypothetical protein